jgi:hypothetical protein
MKNPHSLRPLVIVLMLVASASCVADSITTAPEVRSPSDLRLLHVLPGTPPLALTQASFYAIKGRNAGIDLYFRAAPGQSDSAKFLEFRMGGASLDRRPDGSAIAEGDSILITLTVTDATHLMVEFQPSGLVFSPNDKPKLKMFFASCGEDLNYDGRVDAADASIQNQLGIWRQERPGDPWYRLGSIQISNLKELDAELLGFTGYAAAY